MANKKDPIIEGIIIDVDLGYGLKYKDPNSIFLQLEIQMFDGFLCTQLFGMDKIGKILIQFKSDYRNNTSVKQLLHRKVYLLDENINKTPSAIAPLPPSEYPEYKWIENDNWN